MLERRRIQRVGRLSAANRAIRLFRFLDRLGDLVEIRPVAGFEFGMEQFAISTNLESAAARRDQGERFDTLAELENFGRQTDGLRRVVSNNAVFDRNFGLHRQTPFRSETIDVIQPGQGDVLILTKRTFSQSCDTLQKCNLYNQFGSRKIISTNCFAEIGSAEVWPQPAPHELRRSTSQAADPAAAFLP